MSRLPFNSSRMAKQPDPPVLVPAPSDSPSLPAETAWTVSQLAAAISGVIETGMPGRIRILGEVSNFKDRTHWYFDLKDASAVINCVMFITHVRKVKFVPRNGQEVVISGRVEFYGPQGRISLKVDKVEPVGAGALELAYKALCDELRALGWFALERKRPIPAFPRRIAVITSRTGAALQDVLDTMRRRCCATDIATIDVRVQGQGAAEEIACAVRWVGANHQRLGIDAILVTRGGGSMEDLWAFHERIVAHAIVHSPIPVVAAIGHETDTTIAELVADLRAATPTQAAMRLTPDRAALLEQLDSLASRLRTTIRRGLRDRARRVDAAARHPFMADPGVLVERERRHLDVLRRHLRGSQVSRLRTAASRLERLAGRLESYRPAALHARREAVVEGLERRLLAAIRQRTGRGGTADRRLETLDEHLQRAWSLRADRAQNRLEALARQLSAVGPASVLRRGFSYTLREDGTLVRAPADVRPGERIRTRLANGEIASLVEVLVEGEDRVARPKPANTEAPRETPIELARPRRIGPRKHRARVSTNQMDLFERTR
jgi:exodeoxyribonuclease VII large subunit